LDRGFDRYFGNISGNCDYYTHIYTGRHDWYEGNESKKVEGYATYLLADEASRFIRDNREWPFFLYLPFNAAHFPNRKNKAPGEPVIWQAPDGAFEALGYSPDTQDETQRYHAVLWALDEGIGRVLKSIGESGVRDKTLVMLISDNGAFMLTGRGLEGASNKPLRSGGVTTWEGGIRVPAIFRWPDKLEAGTECRDALWSLDVLPLILRAAGAKMPSDRVFDGKDPLSTLQGHSGSPHELLCWRYGKYSGLRQGDWKLVQEKPGAEWQLFNLKSDLGETANLASSQPDIHRRLVRRFEDWLARMPYQE